MSFIARIQMVFVKHPVVAWSQDRQCTYIVTLRRIRATFAAEEKQYVLHILSMCL